MVVPVTPDSYTPCLNETFSTPREGGGVHVFTLKTVERRFENEGQVCFSLLFHNPDTSLPQRSYRLTHARLGEIDLFLVPIQRKRDGVLYEAVFNLLKDEAQ